jgi:hypothetical protein
VNFIFPVFVPPVFEPALEPVNILVEIDKIKNGLVSKDYTYKSSPATDVKNYTIIISKLKFTPALPCDCHTFKDNNDKTFSIDINLKRMSIKDKGTYEVSFNLANPKMNKTYNMTFIIDVSEEKIIIFAAPPPPLPATEPESEPEPTPEPETEEELTQEPEAKEEPEPEPEAEEEP